MVMSAAIVAVVLFGIMIVFQSLLVLGLPLGHLAYGGQQKKLPVKFRVLSVVAVGVFILASLVVLERVSLIEVINNPGVTSVIIWVLAVYFTLGVLMNAISRSKWEKIIMTPMAFVMAVCCTIIAIFG